MYDLLLLLYNTIVVIHFFFFFFFSPYYFDGFDFSSGDLGSGSVLVSGLATFGSGEAPDYFFSTF